jgi:hypothetical protein
VWQVDERSLVVSVDPNTPHRGVVNPLQQVISLLNLFELQRNVLVLTGYSLEKSISNDGLTFAAYDPVREFTHEVSCEQQLTALTRLVRSPFDFCVIDGNHDPAYLSREIRCVDAILKPGGLLILDDVHWRFPEIEDTYRKWRAVYATVGADGRVGILMKT